ncbi:hypothetical protein CYMTET_50292 [Cymbomonas tetramitiformis]|uniref:Uncharacterized protein n=1 Tax=Cymbomonas tetramitiformis TaxID=36881 RepID=A0AAE0BQ21_9CHLO|nr:hypothetical protein CYMTET_50292 [Cymbomonas tetramitiformis]
MSEAAGMLRTTGDSLRRVSTLLPMRFPRARRLLLNGILMSTCFAISEGSLLAVTAISAALIDPYLSALGSAMLYLSFAVGCISAPSAVRRLGSKNSLVLGTFAFVIYIAAASTSDITERQAINQFAAFFAAIFPFGIAIMKIGTSVIIMTVTEENTVLYSLLTICALAAMLGMCLVDDLEARALAEGDTDPCTPASLEVKGILTETYDLINFQRDAKILLLVPTNIAFGLCSAFFPYKVSLLVKDSVGKVYVGWLYSLSGIVGSILAILYASFCHRFSHGRVAVVGVGAISFASSIIAVTFCPAPTESWALVLYWTLLFAGYGSGVTVWQGTVMAVFGDMYKTRTLLAFASMKLHSGLASALAFFAIPYLSLDVAAAFCLVFIVCGYGGYLWAEFLSHKEATRLKYVEMEEMPGGHTVYPSGGSTAGMDATESDAHEEVMCTSSCSKRGDLETLGHSKVEDQ